MTNKKRSPKKIIVVSSKTANQVFKDFKRAARKVQQGAFRGESKYELSFDNKADLNDFVKNIPEAMGFPNEEELKSVRKNLENAESSRLLPKNASKADLVKYKLCEKFVVYLMEHKTSQIQLAKRLKVDHSRINEIVKYRIDLYTIDKLMELAERLHLDFKVEVA